MDDEDIARLAAAVGERLRERGERIALAESCTGGWIAKALTDVAGSSRWFACGWVCYSDDAKRSMLGVSAATLQREGAVSEAVCRELAAGALARSGAERALAVSGIAGPEGGTPDKPVGTVCFAWAARDGSRSSATRRFDGDREAVRRQSVEAALDTLYSELGP